MIEAAPLASHRGPSICGGHFRDVAYGKIHYSTLVPAAKKSTVDEVMHSIKRDHSSLRVVSVGRGDKPRPLARHAQRFRHRLQTAYTSRSDIPTLLSVPGCACRDHARITAWICARESTRMYGALGAHAILSERDPALRVLEGAREIKQGRRIVIVMLYNRSSRVLITRASACLRVRPSRFLRRRLQNLIPHRRQHVRAGLCRQCLHNWSCAVAGRSASSIARFSLSSMNERRSRETRPHSWAKANFEKCRREKTLRIGSRCSRLGSGCARFGFTRTKSSESGTWRNSQRLVLHAFEKKTQQTAKREIDLAKSRFRELVAERRRERR